MKKRDELRKVSFKNICGEKNKGFFHQWIIEKWGNSYGGVSTYVYALIETESGKVLKVDYDDITFID
ncbi:hypothetical protein ABFP60_14710 [Clostridioides difficile]